MKPFEQFCIDVAAQFGGFNGMYEAGMYALLTDIEKITKALDEVSVRFEVLGGAAVNAHIMPIRRAQSFVTRDLDILVYRSELERIREIATKAGYEAKKTLGGFMLIQPGQDPGEAVHLLFAGEISRPNQVVPHPAEVRPQMRMLLGLRIPVAPLEDLVRMKLTSFRLKDILHLQILDKAGLVTKEIEKGLPDVLQQRLATARAQYGDEVDIDQIDE